MAMRIGKIWPLAGALGVLLGFLGPVARAEVLVGAPRREAAPPRGGSLTLDRAELVAYVADADNAALHRVDLVSGDVVTTPLACAPQEVLLLGRGRVAVSLRGCGQVQVLEIDPAGAGGVVASAKVPSEPWGLARAPSGEVLVASAWGHALTSLDAETLAIRA